MLKVVVPPAFASYVFLAELLGLPAGVIEQRDLERILILAALATLFSGFFVVAYYVNALKAAKIALDISQATTKDWKEQADLERVERTRFEEIARKLEARVKELEALPDYAEIVTILARMESSMNQLAADSVSRLIQELKEKE